MLCYSELQELVGYGVLVMQRVTVDGIGEILRVQRSGLSCRAGARKRRGSWGWGDGFDKKTRSSVKAGGGYEYDAPSGSSDRMQRVVYRSISRSRVDGDDIITFTWPSDFSEAPTGRQRDGEMVKVEGPARARAIGLVQNRRRRHAYGFTPLTTVPVCGGRARCHSTAVGRFTCSIRFSSTVKLYVNV
jgi:hypothetical protein